MAQINKANPLIDSILICLVLFLSIFSVYFTTSGLNQLFFGLLLFIFYKTEKDYFWIAFFLAINLNPGGFFMEGSKESLHRLPLYTLTSGLSLGLFDLFLLVAFIKAIQKKIKIIYGYNFLIPAFGILLLLIVGLADIANLQTYVNFVRGIAACTLIYSIPVLLNKEISLYKFIYCFFPFVFFEILCQLYVVKTGQMIVQQFDPGFYLMKEQLSGGTIRATGYGYSIELFALIFSFIFFIAKNKILPSWYIVLVISMCLLSAILSATRQTVILYSIIILLNSVYTKVLRFNRIIFLATGLIIVYFLVSHFYVTSKAIEGSFNRFSTGFIEDAKTNSFVFRIKYRLPIILDNIEQSPIFGYGVSSRYYKIQDSHLGGILLVLLQGGIVGLLIMFAFMFNLFTTNRKYLKLFARSNIIWGKYFKVLIVGFIGFFFVNLIIDVFYIYPIRGFSIILLYIAMSIIIINHGLNNKYFVHE